MYVLNKNKNIEIIFPMFSQLKREYILSIISALH